VKRWLWLLGWLPALAAAGLPARVERVLSAHDLPLSSYSAWVQAAGAERPLLAVNADEPRNPASTIKLLTTFLALEELGPDYRWRTEAYLLGELSADGVLDGDLLVKGYGDPYLVTERLWLFLRKLRQRGLRDIRGDLVIDNSYFAVPADAPRGRFDGQPYRVYNVPPDALLINFNAISFLFLPDPAAGRVRVIADPAPANLEILNQLQLVDGRCRGFQHGIRFAANRDQQPPRVAFSGRYGSECGEFRLSRAVLTAPEYAYGVIRRLWEESGGRLRGGLRRGLAPAGAEPFLAFPSLPLAEIIRRVNKWSNNVMTRQIFLTMGAERFGPPGDLDKARAAVAEALAARGLDFPELRLDNGAGLSRDTRISARNLGRLLLAAEHSPFRAEFESSLALAGLDGTMRRRFRDEDATGQMHLKTGRLNGVFAMAGYVHARSGRDYAVVAIQNHPLAHRGPAEEAHSELLRWVFEQ